VKTKIEGRVMKRTWLATVFVLVFLHHPHGPLQYLW